MDRKYLWFITPKTNLHVGDENVTNFGLVDKMVQRDVLTTLPCIHSSSLKGALSEFVSVKLGKSEEVPPDKSSLNIVKSIFGSDNLKPEDSQKGTHTFFDAHLLFLPVPSSRDLFYMATCPSVLKGFVQEMEMMNCPVGSIDELRQLTELPPTSGKPYVFLQAEPEHLKLAGQSVFSWNEEKLGESRKKAVLFLKSSVGKDIAILSDEDFVELCNDENLPIIARNKLEKGESKNLWYEQVVPRETVFYTFILEKGEVSLKEQLLKGNESQVADRIQIGANATIGYGYCNFKLVASK